jgi:hypothetical protein
MMKLAVLALAIVALAAVASATTMCAQISPIAYANGYTCETANGFVFTNFQLTSGTLPSDGSLFFTQSLTGATVNLESANLVSNYSLSYGVSLDPAIWTSPVTFLSTANVGLSAIGNANATLVLTVTPPGASDTFTQVANVGTQSGVINGIGTTAATVTDVYTYSGSQPTPTGQIQNGLNGFNEATGPEPSTMLLMGGALLGLGAMARKRSKKTRA